MHPAWKWFKRAKAESVYTELDPKIIAQDYDVPIEDVRTVIQFISTNSAKRVETFKFLLEQLTNV